MATEFVQLNYGWNAEPNVPNPQVQFIGRDLKLTFLMNAFQFPTFSEGDIGTLRFKNCWRYRLGGTNDEGWYLGQCRFSNAALAWGEFYQVVGDLLLERDSEGWALRGSPGPMSQHYLFYFRDETFECDGDAWDFAVKPVAAP